MNKVIFLDFDGVLNNITTLQYRGANGLDPKLASLVNNIIKRTGAAIVVSSTWRHWPRIDWMRALKKAKLWTDYVIGTTPIFPNEIRGNEIQSWLDQHEEVTRYAILDDDSDMLPAQMPNLFQTSIHTGLTKEIVERVVKHLGELSTEARGE